MLDLSDERYPEGMFSRDDLYRVAIISDKDKASKQAEADGSGWTSEMWRGSIRLRGGQWSVQWGEKDVLQSHWSDSKRGMELSELMCVSEGV